jgi:hypothetical protein
LLLIPCIGGNEILPELTPVIEINLGGIGGVSYKGIQVSEGVVRKDAVIAVVVGVKISEKLLLARSLFSCL